jgi:hypothetical protein
LIPAVRRDKLPVRRTAPCPAVGTSDTSLVVSLCVAGTARLTTLERQGGSAMDGRTVLLVLLSEHNAGKVVAVACLLFVVIAVLEVRDRRRRKR